MEHRPFDILVAGEINVDLILTGQDVHPVFGQEKLVQDATITMGSSSVIFACQAARLGLKVAFVGKAGTDTLGDFMLQQMAAHGLDISHVQRLTGEKTGLTVSLSEPGDRAMLTHLGGSIATLTLSDITDNLLKAARHLHISSAFLQEKLQPDLPALFTNAKALGCSTSLDTGWDPAEHWSERVRRCLALADVLMPNEEEAPLLSQTETPEMALGKLAAMAPWVAVKLGKRGAIAAAGEERSACVPFTVPVVDTTGAGDSFDAGFIYGYLSGWSLARSLKLACACGALSTRAAGGTGSQATLTEALALVDSRS